VGGTCQARSAGNFFLSCRTTKKIPALRSRDLHFFGFTSTISRFGKRLIRVVSTVWSLSWFLFCLLSVPPCPSVIYKSVGTCPRALDGVSVTFLLQFHTRKHYKTAIQSECIASAASQGLFPIFAFKITQSDTFNSSSSSTAPTQYWVMSRFCILLTIWGARVSSASMARRFCVSLWFEFYLASVTENWSLDLIDWKT